MRKEPVLGLAGLILTGVLGCETNRPYCTRCMMARNNYGQAETAYRPKTVVTMRADEVPENPVPAQTCPAIQLVSASSTTAALASGQATGPGQTVTVTIPAMKIVVPVNAAVAAPPMTVKETSAVNELPPSVGSMVQASGTASISSSSSATAKSKDANHQAAAPVEKKETASSSPMTEELPPSPEPVHESKSKGKSATINSEPVRLPRLSALPPEPPPDIPVHRSSSPTTSRLTDVPPPPPIPKPQPASGPVLPSEEAAPQ
jgi:hypothetical protein